MSPPVSQSRSTTIACIEHHAGVKNRHEDGDEIRENGDARHRLISHPRIYFLHLRFPLRGSEGGENACHKHARHIDQNNEIFHFSLLDFDESFYAIDGGLDLDLVLKYQYFESADDSTIIDFKDKHLKLDDLLTGEALDVIAKRFLESNTLHGHMSPCDR